MDYEVLSVQLDGEVVPESNPFQSLQVLNRRSRTNLARVLNSLDHDKSVGWVYGADWESLLQLFPELRSTPGLSKINLPWYQEKHHEVAQVSPRKHSFTQICIATEREVLLDSDLSSFVTGFNFVSNGQRVFEAATDATQHLSDHPDECLLSANHTGLLAMMHRTAALDLAERLHRATSHRA